MTVKRCRCKNQKEREVPCYKEYLCESKCSKMRDCGKHQCKRKVGGNYDKCSKKAETHSSDPVCYSLFASLFATLIRVFPVCYSDKHF